MRHRAGFTLVELLVVVAIIGIIGTTVTVRVIGHVAEARRVQTRAMIQQIGDALEIYRLHNGSYPTEGQGLQKLTEPSDRMGGEPYIERIPTDLYGEEFIYRVQDVDHSGDINIISKGKDRQEGTPDDLTLRPTR
jgi:general secretion pathway protein G